MKIQTAIARLLGNQDLTESDARKTFHLVFKQRVTKPAAKALLLLLAKKGETAPEVTGCLKALRPLEPPMRLKVPRLMDTCGTGGDRSGSLNVSTLAAFVIAGAGGKVAKHGNRSISSRCGSSDLIEALGIRLDTSPKKMLTAIRRFGMGYFHAPLYHPVFSRLQPLRRELGTRTIFNLLGPLTNPVGVRHQLVGVSSKRDLRLFAEVLKNQKRQCAMICHSRDGLDEISISAPTDVTWVQNGSMAYGSIDPARYGLHHPRKKMPAGGTPLKNSRQALAFLKNRLKGPGRDVILLNAACGLVVAGLAKNISSGIRLAEASLQSGRAYRVLLGLKRLSHSR